MTMFPAAHTYHCSPSPPPQWLIQHEPTMLGTVLSALVAVNYSVLQKLYRFLRICGKTKITAEGKYQHTRAAV